MKETIRVLRIIEYVGPRKWVEDTIIKSVHGTKIWNTKPLCKISAATIGAFPLETKET